MFFIELYAVLYVTKYKFLLFFYLTLAATIILNFSLRLTRTSCYFSSLSTFPPLYISRSPLALHLYSFSRIPVPSCRRAIHTSILPHHARMPSLSVSPFHWRSSSSFLFRLLFVLFSLFLTPPRLAHVLFSSSFIFLFYFMSLSLCPVLAYLSFFVSRLLLPLARVSDLVVFALSFHPPRSYPSTRPLLLLSSLPLALEAHTSLSSRSIELRSSGSFYLARSSYFLLFHLFLLRLQPPPSLSLSFFTLSFSVSLFSPFVSLSRSIPRISPGAVRLVLGLSLCSSFSFFFLPARGWWPQELFILCRKVVRSPPDPFG